MHCEEAAHFRSIFWQCNLGNLSYRLAQVAMTYELMLRFACKTTLTQQRLLRSFARLPVGVDLIGSESFALLVRKTACLKPVCANSQQK
jgi:hypothetical protein